MVSQLNKKGALLERIFFLRFPFFEMGHVAEQQQPMAATVTAEEDRPLRIHGVSGHSGRGRVVLGHTLNILRRVITKVSQCLK